MAAGGDIVELVHKMTYLGQEMNNVYYFEAAIADADLEVLATWFETNVVAKVKDCQIADVLHDSLELRNLFDLGETHSETLTGNGSNVGGAMEMPSFVAASIKLNHTTGGIRSGYKRIGGFDEVAITDAVFNITMLNLLVAVGELLVVPPAVALTSWVHCIVGRVCETPNPTPGAYPSCLKYRLPESQAEAVVAYPTTYTINAQPTTQNSRKWYT